MSPSTEYPLAITDMIAVCQTEHGPPGGRLPTTKTAADIRLWR